MASNVKRPRLLVHPEETGESKECSMAAAAGKARVVLALCGSFSPITNLHLRMFELARDFLHQMGGYVVEKGVISCVHDAYGKKGLVASHHRVAMCQLAVETSKWITVNPWESEQESKWTPTAQVLQQLQEQLSCQNTAASPAARLKLLCGADLLESFAVPDLWKDEDIQEIVGKFGLVVISRNGHNADKFVYESDRLHSLRNNILICTEWIANDVSSTKIRRSLKRGESIKYLVPDSVIDYIKTNDLYH